jgi:hypothetical protein
MVERVLVPLDTPFQRIAGSGGGNGKAVADSRLDFRGFLVIVPRNELE